MDGTVKTAEQIMAEIEDLRQMIMDFEAGETGGSILREQLEKAIGSCNLANDELSKERNKFESMLGAMQSGITIRDLDFNIIYQNEPVTEVFGDRIGEKCYRAYEGRDQICEGCPVVLAYEDGLSHTSLREVTAPSGEIQFWENTANPIRDANGKIVSCLEACTNITERKKAEEALQESEERFRALSDAAFEAVVFTVDGVLLDANKAFLEMYNTSLEAIKGKSVIELVAPEYRGLVIEKIKSGYEGVYEHQGICQDGTLIDVEVHGQSIFYQGQMTRMTAIRDITQRKKAQRELEESELRFRSIIQDTTAGYFFIDKDGIIRDVNEAWVKLYGYSSAEEIVGQNFAVIQQAEDIEQANEFVAGIMRSDPAYMTGEFNRKCRDGSVGHHTFSARPVTQHGAITGIEGFLIDTTEQYKTIDRLKESEDKYKNLLENLPAQIFYKDKDSVYISCNNNYAKDLGITPEEITGKTDHDFYPKELAEKYRLDDRRVMESCETEEIIEDYLVAGQERTIKTVKTPVADDKGDLIGILGFFWDITEQKKIEDALQEGEERFRLMMEQSPSVIEFYDLDGLQVEVNHAYEVLWGFPAEHTVGIFNVLKSKEVQDSGLTKYLKRAYAGESVKLPEYEYDSTGETEGRGLGRKRWLNTRIYPLKDKSGIVKGIVITHEDITDRKQAEKESENLMRSLESKNKELQSIVYTASHDLKSPLVNIDGFGGEMSNHCKVLVNLLNDIELAPQKKELIESVLREDIPESLRFIRMGTRKMKELLDGLLRVSRYGSSDILIEPLDMNGLIKSIVDTMQFQVDEKSISVSIDDLPGCLGDSQQISQVFSNILDNAIKYLDPDRKGTIHVSATTENGQCTYCIEDNGIGIDKNHQEKVFEIFHRLHPTGSIPGEGLGLTIASRILDRHKGTIGLESEPNKGTKFHITLPRA